MSRPLRVEFADAVYHVTARGNANEAIFVDDDDRARFLNCLASSATRFDWCVWAYCLMDNHYHLLIETRRPTLSRGMREINGVYSQAFNRRHGRVGHVLQGRFKALLVDRDAYLLELSRYIALNPVRAGCCAAPGDWRWSSYRALMGQAGAPDWLAVKQTLDLFSADLTVARRAFARFVAEGTTSVIPAATAQFVLGDDSFVEKILTRAKPTSSEVPRQQRVRQSLAAYERVASDRDTAIQAAYRSGDYTLAQIGKHFGLHYATISRIARGKPDVH